MPLYGGICISSHLPYKTNRDKIHVKRFCWAAILLNLSLEDIPSLLFHSETKLRWFLYCLRSWKHIMMVAFAAITTHMRNQFNPYLVQACKSASAIKFLHKIGMNWAEPRIWYLTLSVDTYSEPDTRLHKITCLLYVF